MPYSVRKGKGKRPWKIVKKLPGGRTKTVGTSTSKAKAQKSVRARYRSER